MPPRIRLRTLAQLAELSIESAPTYTCGRCSRLYATAAAATTPAPSDAQMRASIPTLARYPPVQPPSHRNPAYRKSQLLRSYVSLLQTTPLIIFFQHNNLKATEWVSIRRELAVALRKLDAQLAAQGKPPHERIGEYIKLQAAYEAAQQHKNEHPLTPGLAGSVAILTFPAVSPTYLKTAFSILSPQPPLFPAPTRRAVPQYYEPAVQDGLKKLLLLGARVDGQLFDMEGTRWVGSIDGGIDGLRAQLVAMLQGFGAAMVHTLESGSRSLWFTMEGRRRMLEEEEEKPQGNGEEEEKKG
ncbi:hypothetical protein AYL99_05605 [Fonsecaea erecta]|uniref:Ribosomal protein L10 n=1 Tax=Fonsecaea erecta TaxID=1367422 RepID=A0A178ZN35_9EURO|nr:hypothetical protein AYL99_05605 [Fonsecaea erecta]OAP60603.1 hypothetical protein AYL99_05605 [Fonsecaea erecta]